MDIIDKVRAMNNKEIEKDLICTIKGYRHDYKKSKSQRELFPIGSKVKIIYVNIKEPIVCGNCDFNIKLKKCIGYKGIETYNENNITHSCYVEVEEEELWT